MEAVILCGVQGAGKSTFFRERFFDTHVRISRDLLRTPHRERVFLAACLETRQPFVVDKINPQAADRRPYVEAALAHGYRVVAYWLDVPADDAVARNAARPEHSRVPVKAILGTRKRLEPPSPAEGFAAVHRVLVAGGGFTVETLVPPANSSQSTAGDEGEPNRQ